VPATCAFPGVRHLPGYPSPVHVVLSTVKTRYGTWPQPEATWIQPCTGNTSSAGFLSPDGSMSPGCQDAQPFEGLAQSIAPLDCLAGAVHLGGVPGCIVEVDTTDALIAFLKRNL